MASSNQAANSRNGSSASVKSPAVNPFGCCIGGESAIPEYQWCLVPGCGSPVIEEAPSRAYAGRSLRCCRSGARCCRLRWSPAAAATQIGFDVRAQARRRCRATGSIRRDHAAASRPSPAMPPDGDLAAARAAVSEALGQGGARRQRAVGGSRRPARAARSRRCRTPTARTAPPAATSSPAMCATAPKSWLQGEACRGHRAAGRCARCGPGGGPEAPRSVTRCAARALLPTLSHGWGNPPAHEEARRARTMRDPYQVLGVSKSASAADIKSAYRKLAKKLHPDANKSDPKAASRFSELNAAYEIVGDDDKRKAFDRGEIDAEGKPRFQGFEGFGGGGPRGGAGGPFGGQDGAFETFTWGPEGMQRTSGAAAAAVVAAAASRTCCATCSAAGGARRTARWRWLPVRAGGVRAAAGPRRHRHRDDHARGSGQGHDPARHAADRQGARGQDPGRAHRRPADQAERAGARDARRQGRRRADHGHDRAASSVPARRQRPAHRACR